MESDPGSTFHNLYLTLMQPQGPKAFLEQPEQGYQILLEEPRVAYYNTIEGRSQDCAIVPAWITDFPGLISFVLAKESALGPFLNYAVLLLYENGMVPIMSERLKDMTKNQDCRWVQTIAQLKVHCLFLKNYFYERIF